MFRCISRNHDYQTLKISLGSLQACVGVPMNWLAAVVCLFFLAVLPAQADSLVGSAYNVAGSVTFSENNHATVDFSSIFQWVEKDPGISEP
jgi:hypothetical protein